MGHRDLLVTRTYLRQTPNARVCPREASAGRLSSSRHIGSSTAGLGSGPRTSAVCALDVQVELVRATSRPHLEKPQLDLKHPELVIEVEATGVSDEGQIFDNELG